MKNLHVVFTMNPSADGLKDRAATSPALFNRCVLNWFGDWSNSALYQGKSSSLASLMMFSIYIGHHDLVAFISVISFLS